MAPWTGWTFSMHAQCVTIPPISAIFVLFVSWSIYKYVKLEKKGNKCLYCMGLVFFIITDIMMMVQIPRNILYCMDMELYLKIRTISGLLYLLQSLYVLMFLFLRLVHVFNNTSLKISRCGITLYLATYVCLIAIGTLGLITYSSSWPNTLWRRIIFITTGLFTVSLTFILTYIFVSKLLFMHKQVAQDVVNLPFLTLVSRLSLLTTMSIITTLLFVTLLVLSISDFILTAVLHLDVITNFLSILWGYKQFSKQYQKVCGICDAKCYSIGQVIVMSKAYEKRPSSTRSVVVHTPITPSVPSETPKI